MKVIFHKNKILTLLLCAFAILLVGHSLALWFLLHLERPNALGIVPLFHFDREGNLPTLFSGLQLGLAAILAFGIAQYLKQNTMGSHRHWFLIGMVLTFLGIDEVATVHDKLDSIMMSRIDTTGLIEWPWVIPYSILSVIVMVVFLPFYLRLPRPLKICFGLSAGLYVTGAIGFEMLAAQHAEHAGDLTVRYAILMTIEECMEILAVTILIAGLLSHIVRNLDGMPSETRIA